MREASGGGHSTTLCRNGGGGGVGHETISKALNGGQAAAHAMCGGLHPHQPHRWGFRGVLGSPNQEARGKGATNPTQRGPESSSSPTPWGCIGVRKRLRKGHGPHLFDDVLITRFAQRVQHHLVLLPMADEGGGVFVGPRLHQGPNLYRNRARPGGTHTRPEAAPGGGLWNMEHHCAMCRGFVRTARAQHAQHADSARFIGRNQGILGQLAIFLPVQTILHPHTVIGVLPLHHSVDVAKGFRKPLLKVRFHQRGCDLERNGSLAYRHHLGLQRAD